MEVFDRTLASITGHILHLTGCGTTKGAQHLARVLQLLQTISSLCTYLNAHGGDDAEVGKCSFYTPERDGGLDEHALFRPLQDAGDAEGREVDWEALPATRYWNVFVMHILRGLGRAPSDATLHQAAIRIQLLAIKPMGACIERRVATSFCDSVAGKVLLQHLAALTGPAMNSSIKTMNAADFATPASRATSADVRDITENADLDVHDATLIHLLFFAGPVENMGRKAREAYCTTLSDISREHGGEVAALINTAATVANDSMHRVILPLKCNPLRRDYVLDESLFMHAVRMLTAFRNFIEYEKLL